MTNYQIALQNNREDLLETIANLESERRKVDKAIGDLETTKEAITKGIAAMKQLVSNYDAELRLAR
jgi:phage shock protein A